jgi:hypothetical protein
MAHGSRNQRLATRSLQRLRDREEEADTVDRPHTRIDQHCIGEQTGGQHDLRDAAEHEHLAAIQVVGERAAVETEHHERQ